MNCGAEDLDEMNIEILRNTLYKAYLDDFAAFCNKLGGATAEVMGDLLAFEVLHPPPPPPPPPPPHPFPLPPLFLIFLSPSRAAAEALSIPDLILAGSDPSYRNET